MLLLVNKKTPNFGESEKVGRIIIRVCQYLYCLDIPPDVTIISQD